VTDLAFDDPCILFAMRRESQPFLREFRSQQRFRGAPCWTRFCGPAWLSVLVLQTGVGQARTEAALNWILSRPLLGAVPYQPKLVLSAGFSGALQPDFRVGDIILATEVTTSDGRSWPVTWPVDVPEGEWRPQLHRARLLSLPTLVGSPEEKASLGNQHRAAAVDMETATVARTCGQRNVPFGCVRVILDDLHTPLSARLASLVSDGRVSPLRTLAALVSSPSLGFEFGRLARRSRYAAEQLGRALGELLTLTLPWGRDL
jgi:adenosylhomocysteine nucleosidase